MARVGVLGAGFMGSTHAGIYKQLASAQLVAVADANRPLADELAGKHGVRAYYDIDSLLADPEIEAVDVCLPTFLHERCVLGAAKQGKHVLCEKPVALSIDQVDKMIDAVDKAGVISMVGQVIRFWPQYVAIHDLLRKGELGDPLMVTATRLSAPPAWGNWFKDPKLSGGAVLDLHIHDLDYVYWLLGMPKSVYAVGLQGEMGAWDYVQTSLTFDKARAVVEASFLMPKGFPFQMAVRVMGSKATAEYRFRVLGQVGERSQAETELRLYRPDEPAQSLPSAEKDAYVAELEYFVQCLNERRQPRVATLRQARDTLRIALAARRSAETGQAVVP